MSSGNLENQGQTTGQDEGNESKENSWKSQAKYFQSEKDKLYEENRTLKKYEKLGKVLQSRPDIVEDIKTKLTNGETSSQGNQSERVGRPKEFDPWDAYNNPESNSYKYRQQEIQDTINQQVSKQVDEKTAHFTEEQNMDKLVGELKARGMNDNDVKNFLDFANKNPAEYGLDGILSMYNAYTTGNAGNSDAIDQVKQTQSSPATGGVLNGQLPQETSDEDEMWKGVLKANRVGNKIP